MKSNNDSVLQIALKISVFYGSLDNKHPFTHFMLPVLSKCGLVP